MALVALAAVRGDAHPREVRGGLRLSEEVEEDRGRAVLPVVVVGLDPRVVVAVRDASLPDIEADEAGAALDRGVERGIGDARLAREDERDQERNAGRVHHAVAREASVLLDESMSP